MFTAQDFQAAGHIDGQLLIDQLMYVSLPSPSAFSAAGLRMDCADSSVIRDDETTHLKTLQGVATTLGGSTADLDSCQFDFSAAMADVASFLATARVLEFVGIDA